MPAFQGVIVMASPTPTASGPVHKTRPSAARRALRLVGSALDPRAWLHLVRFVNHLNTTHVVPRRALRLVRPYNISPDVNFSNPERILAGRGLRLGSGCYLWAGHATGHIRMGENVMFGPGVIVTCAGYRFNDGQPVTDQAMDEADVTIGDDVWIGANVTILAGVTIGPRTIVAAGAVVTQSFPEGHVIIGGIPAREIRRLPARL